MERDSKIKPQITILGPLLGKNPGWVTSQGDILADGLRKSGWEVLTASHYPSRLRRLADTLVSLWKWRRRVDVAVVMVFSGPAFWMADLTSWAARRLGMKVVFWLHGGNLPDYSAHHLRRVSQVYRRGAAWVAPTGYLAEYLKHLGFEAQVIPNIVNLSNLPFKLRERATPNLLWMRTFHELYQPEMAVRVLARLRSEGIDAILTMAGQDKGLLTSTQALVNQLGVAPFIRFAGFLNESAKPIEFERHDIFLNTNRVDNTPVSVIEAMASGLPVVATAVGGVPYLIANGETGILVPVGDDQAMASGVINLLDTPLTVARISQKARNSIQNCELPAVIPLWERLFDQI